MSFNKVNASALLCVIFVEYFNAKVAPIQRTKLTAGPANAVNDCWMAVGAFNTTYPGAKITKPDPNAFSNTPNTKPGTQTS